MSSESVSIPKNPRTDRPVGYAFVDLSTPSEAERAITDLSGKEILERKVSVQLARKPEAAGEKVEGANGEGGEGTRRRPSTRGRARANRGRGATRGRGGRGSGGVSSTLAWSCLPRGQHADRCPYRRRRRRKVQLRLLERAPPRPPLPPPTLPPRVDHWQSSPIRERLTRIP